MSSIFVNLRKVLILILFTLFIYCVLRITHIVWNWNIYSQYSMWSWVQALFWGVRFDICVILLLGLPTVLVSWLPPKAFQYVGGASWWGLQSLAILFTAVDVELVHFGGRRMVYSSLFLARELAGKHHAFFTTYWLLSLIFLILVGSLGWVTLKIMRSSVVPSLEKASKPVILILLLVAYVVGARGGLQSKPLSTAHAHIFTTTPLNLLILNSGFTMIKSWGHQALPESNYFTQVDEVLHRLNGYSKQSSSLEGLRIPQQNVVILIMESFSLEYTGFKGQAKSYTPFLDSLAQKSLSFRGVANGRRSIEAIPAILAGIPSLMEEPLLTSPYASNFWQGLGFYLQPSYRTAFFHGGQNGTMLFDQFAKLAQIQDYYGANEYPDKKDFDGTWGIYDEPFMQWMLQQINSMPRPFAVSFFSLSSHHPYKLPSVYENHFPKGTLEIHKSIGYADMALKKFFTEAEKQPWFKDTLFVITGDHTQKSDQKEYQNPLGPWLVPIIFYHPNYKWPPISQQKIVQHVDILPSVLDFLGVTDNKKLLFGQSIFIPEETYALLRIDQTYELYTEKYWVESRGEEYQFFDNQSFEPINVSESEKSELIQKIKANKQYFNQGLNRNKIYNFEELF